MAEVDLQPAEAAVAALREKYPAFVFKTDFELGERGTRGIFDVHISRANNLDDAATLSMIVPNEKGSEKDYQKYIEEELSWRFGLRS